MKKSKTLFPILFIVIIIIYSCKKEKLNNLEIVEKNTLNKINTTEIVKKDNVLEMFQTFSIKNNDSEITSNKVKIDLTVTSGAMISAYSIEKGNYLIYFKTKEKDSWSDWIELNENLEVNNPNRKVFAPKSLNNKVEEIQFKSNQTLKQKVVFRIFTFKK